MIAPQAAFAVLAAAAEPAHAHALADAQILYVLAKGGDDADDLMARDQRVGAIAKLVVDHRKIRMAKAARFHSDVDLIAADVAESVFKGLEPAPFLPHSKGMYLLHSALLFRLVFRGF